MKMASSQYSRKRSGVKEIERRGDRAGKKGWGGDLGFPVLRAREDPKGEHTSLCSP